MKSSAEALLTVINDVLDFSKIEAGRLDLDETDFDLRETVGDAAKLLALRAAEKGLELACDVAPDVPDVLIGDPGRLRQVLFNLVGNAVKFTSQRRSRGRGWSWSNPTPTTSRCTLPSRHGHRHRAREAS